MFPIRILHVVGKMHYGGMETMIMNIYRNIDKSKIQFDFMVHYDDEGDYDKEILKLGGRIYVMPRTLIKNYYMYKKYLKAFFKSHNEFKIIHGHLISTAFIYHRIAKLYGPKICITHSHSNSTDDNLRGKISYYTSKLSEKYTDIFLGCSKQACLKFFPKASATGKEIIIFKNTIDAQKYVFNMDKRNYLRKKLKLDDNFVVGHIGRFVDPKNHLFLLDIFNKILKVNPNSILMLVGKGPLESEVKNKIKDLGIESRVVFIRDCENIWDMLNVMDIFLFPSKFEGLGIVLIEAQANGLRCLTSQDVVPSEAKITDLLNYISLNEPDYVWAENALRLGQDYTRENKFNEVTNAGYNIKEQVSWIEDFYIKLFNKKV